MSVCTIEHAEAMENGQPKANGLLDPRMGTVDKNSKCLSCGGKMEECPGHFGNIKLAKPVYHVSYMNSILKVLQCVCYHCSRLLVDEVCCCCLKAVSICYLLFGVVPPWTMFLNIDMS